MASKVQQEPVVLTRKEFEMLRLLLENKGHVLTRDQLLTQIWGYDFDEILELLGV